MKLTDHKHEKDITDNVEQKHKARFLRHSRKSYLKRNCRCGDWGCSFGTGKNYR